MDSEHVLLVHRQGRAPTYAFPGTDVHGVSSTAEPLAEGYVSVAWDAVDAWYEEAEQVFMHPRNPYHRVDCVLTNRHLLVEIAGIVLVDTSDTLGVYETSLAPRLYVRREHLLHPVLMPSTTTTYCPYKGTASYWTAVVGATQVEDVAWSYEDPNPESLALRSHLSFDEARANVVAELPAPAECRTP